MQIGGGPSGRLTGSRLFKLTRCRDIGWYSSRSRDSRQAAGQAGSTRLADRQAEKQAG